MTQAQKAILKNLLGVDRVIARFGDRHVVTTELLLEAQQGETVLPGTLRVLEREQLIEPVPARCGAVALWKITREGRASVTPPSGEDVCRILSLVDDREFLVERLGALSDDEREAIVRWAGAVHLGASDNSVRTPAAPIELLSRCTTGRRWAHC